MLTIEEYTKKCNKSLFNHLFDVENKSFKRENILPAQKDVFIEIYDKNKLAFILNNKDVLPITDKGAESLNDVFVNISKYYLRSKKNNYSVNYNYCNDVLFGRQYAKFNIGGQSIKKTVRHTIFNEFYDDVDMVNAHPIILLWLCSNLKIDTEYLDVYVSNREKHIKDLLDLNDGLERGMVKNAFLSVIYYNDSKIKYLKNRSEFFNKFQIEIKRISAEIIEKLNIFHELNKSCVAVRSLKSGNIKKNNMFNIEGSTLSKICCFVENELLMIMCMYFKSSKLAKKFKHSILVFDGIMLPKSKEKDLKEYIFDIENIFSKVGINMKLVVKPMDEGLDLIEYDFDPNVKYTYDNESIDKDIIIDFEHKNYFEEDDYMFSTFINEAYKIGVFKSYEDLVDFTVKNLNRVMLIVNDICIRKLNDDQLYDFKNMANTNLRYVFKYYDYGENGDDVTVKPFCLDKFIMHNLQYFHIFDKINFTFDFTRPNKNNVYIARKYVAEYIENIDMVLVNEILEFIKRIFCRNDEIMYNYFIKWLSFIAKYPHLKSRKAFILYSELHQVGKGTILSFLCDFVFGKYMCCPNIKGIKSIANANNYQLLNKKFVVVNELAATKDEFHSGFDDLKSMITDSPFEMKKLYSDTIHAEQFCEFVFCTNNKYSFKIEQGDFRYIVMDVSNEMHGNTLFFTSFIDRISKKHVGDSFYSYLINNIENPNEFRLLDMPQSAAKDSLKNISKSSCELFIDFVKIESTEYFAQMDKIEQKIKDEIELTNDELVLYNNPDDSFVKADSEGRYGKKYLWNKYIDFCKNGNIKNTVKLNVFKDEMTKSAFYLKKYKTEMYYPKQLSANSSLNI